MSRFGGYLLCTMTDLHLHQKNIIFIINVDITYPVTIVTFGREHGNGSPHRPDKKLETGARVAA